jgi:hypothetical protein
MLDNFPERIAGIARNAYASRASSYFSDLLFALGCHELCRDPSISDREWSFSSPVQPDTQYEDIVRKQLIEALRWHGAQVPPHDEHGFSILNGLLRNECWRFALLNVEDAYTLANILTAVAELAVRDPLGTQYKEMLLSCVVPDALLMLGAWIACPLPLTTPLTVELVWRSLFGDAWFDFQVHDLNDLSCIFLDNRLPRPTFLPGLVPAQAEVSAVALPDMDGP